MEHYPFCLFTEYRAVHKQCDTIEKFKMLIKRGVLNYDIGELGNVYIKNLILNLSIVHMGNKYIIKSNLEILGIVE